MSHSELPLTTERKLILAGAWKFITMCTLQREIKSWREQQAQKGPCILSAELDESHCVPQDMKIGS